MKYRCPKCDRVLSTTAGIVLIGKSQRSQGLFVFDARPGCYEYETADNLEITSGSAWSFKCPICHEDLTTAFDKNLASLTMTDKGEEFKVVFSKVADEHATFVVGESKIDSYGEDREDYLENSLKKHYW